MRPETPLGGDGEAALRAGTAGAWLAICLELRTLERSLPPPPRPSRGVTHQRRMAAWIAEKHMAVRRFIEARFEPFAAGTGIMTGYYEPILRGATAPAEAFRTPLHARPPELVEQPVAGNPLRRRYGMIVDGRMEPFHDRAAIDTGALAGRGLELVWVDDPADAFFLHIQGSGRVLLPDGQLLRIGYAGQNGRGYVPIGRLLIERGEIPRERMSMQAIRAWIAEAGHERATELLRGNPSYVFFRRVEGLSPEQGPIGAMGVPLTPQRSVAVDRAHIPLGVPMFVTVRDPEARRDDPPAGRLVVAQDTGGAIRGPARTDFFWGWGPEAGDRAGRMRDEATVFVLLPRPAEVTTAEAQ
jgi:membrane-bound lytic murein transglycosylase A